MGYLRCRPKEIIIRKNWLRYLAYASSGGKEIANTYHAPDKGLIDEMSAHPGSLVRPLLMGGTYVPFRPLNLETTHRMKLNDISKVGSALIVSGALLVSVAKATPISGDINFFGVAKTDTGKLATATKFTTISGVTVVPVDDGNYAGTAGSSATFTPFSFSALGVTPLWSIVIGSTHYWFDATSVSIGMQNKNFLNLEGKGVAYETGYDPTPGTWSITDTGTSATVTFGFSATVPDAGATALLVGLGLVGIGAGLAAQRRFVRS